MGAEHQLVRLALIEPSPLDENKTDRPRSWVLSPDVARMLETWQRVRPTAKATDPIFSGIQWEQLAAVYREHCEAVDITRGASLPGARVKGSRGEALASRAPLGHASGMTLCLRAWVSMAAAAGVGLAACGGRTVSNTSSISSQSTSSSTGTETAFPVEWGDMCPTGYNRCISPPYYVTCVPCDNCKDTPCPATTTSSSTSASSGSVVGDNEGSNITTDVCNARCGCSQVPCNVPTCVNPAGFVCVDLGVGCPTGGCTEDAGIDDAGSEPDAETDAGCPAGQRTCPGSCVGPAFFCTDAATCPPPPLPPC